MSENKKEKTIMKLVNKFKEENNYNKIIRYYGNPNSEIIILGLCPVDSHVNSDSNSVFALDLKDFNQERKSGGVILKVFSDLKLNIDKYFFNNIFKLPSENLSELEIETHIKLLIKEINTIDPNLIICLGTDCYNYIIKIFGTNYNVIKLYHPAYIVRKNYTNYDNYLKKWRSVLINN